jgi:Mg2+-importing ATPase
VAQCAEPVAVDHETVVVGATALALPYAGPVAAVFGLQPLPPTLFAAALAIVFAYAASTELTKRIFYRQARKKRG